MRQTTGTGRRSSEKIVKDIKRATRKEYSSEEKIRIVLDGLRGEIRKHEQELLRQQRVGEIDERLTGPHRTPLPSSRRSRWCG